MAAVQAFGMGSLRLWFGTLVMAASAVTCSAFNGHQVTEGPITLTIGDIPTVCSIQTTQSVRVALTNHSADSLRIKLALKNWVSPCRPLGRTSVAFDLPAHGASEQRFEFTFRPGAFSAQYPIHAFAEFRPAEKPTSITAHAVRIFETRFENVAKASGQADAVFELPAKGSVALTKIANCRPVWQWIGGEMHALPPGWEGNDPESLCYFQRGTMARGQTRASLNVHPPYRKGPGALFLEYQLNLPPAQELRLRFFNAIRDVHPPEPPSDGATFRVWVGEEKVFERHTASTTWLPGEADLSRWAGQTIKLRLEIHPGPKLNTTCDLGFWGDPILLADAASPVAGADDFQSRATQARTAVTSGHAEKGTCLLVLADGMRAAITPGVNGLMDAALAFGSERGAVVIRGFDLSLEGERVGVWESSAHLENVEVIQSENRLELRHHFRLQKEFDRDGRRLPLKTSPATFTARIYADGPGLRLKFSSDARITDAAPGPTDELAEKVYYGHGYAIVRPEKVQAHGGGHNLSTSHVGCDFANGISLLQACDTPPDYFLVDPKERIYSLHTHPAETFTFVPGRKGAMDCAIKYRALYDKKPAPAVAKKAGRFVFDVWGGTYRRDAELLRRCFDYGVTNSLVIMHAWQRWGYDYRLPDIFPPHPGLGTTEDMRQLGETCTRAGALWGLHDNYIDFYPDADGFSYEHVSFDGIGQPRKGWLNEGRDAQAWQFRPDHVQPFLQRNLKLIVPALKPTASFVDVWTSLNAFDYFDCDGRWHSKMKTLRCWGDAFAQIRKAMNNGPTTSEAGSDQLIGWLDGADCQLMQLTPHGGRFSNIVPCADWEQVPWFDLVNHTRFSLHGVGYSDRYQSGRARDEHGIESDDYLSSEILTGHALMADLAMMPRGAVRKYWLMQPFVEKVARDEITAVENPGGDLHRVIVRWASGANAWVNRSTNDWEVAGHVLPPYGFYAKAHQVVCSIEKLGGQVVEQSVNGRTRYVNGRVSESDSLAISPSAERLEALGGRDFRLVVRWQAAHPAPKDLRVFCHFNRPTPGRYTDTEFYAGGDPETPTTAWKGEVMTGTNWTIHFPDNCPPGDYEILCGLYDAQGGGTRYRLIGDARQERRYRVGVLHVEGNFNDGKTNITRISMTVAPTGNRVVATESPARAIDFGGVRTSRGLRFVEAADHLEFVPLPDQPAFEVAVNLEHFARSAADVSALSAVDAKGNRLRQIPLGDAGTSLSFFTQPSDFGYRLDWKTSTASKSAK